MDEQIAALEASRDSLTSMINLEADPTMTASLVAMKEELEATLAGLKKASLLACMGLGDALGRPLPLGKARAPETTMPQDTDTDTDNDTDNDAGFDEVCCLAAKSSDPTRTMPRAIAGTLGGAALLSMVAQLALSGMTPVTSKCPDLACTSANQCQQTFSETTPGCRSFRKYGLSLLRGIIRGPRLACSKRRHCSW